jgi:hypothetical protein
MPAPGSFRFRTKPPRGAVAHVTLAGGSIAVCGVSGCTASSRSSSGRICVKCEAWLLEHADVDLEAIEAAA